MPDIKLGREAEQTLKQIRAVNGRKYTKPYVTNAQAAYK